MSRYAVDRATIVYRATNTVNGKTYIGLTTQGLSQRIRDHQRVARRGEGYLLHSAIRKYGEDKVSFEVMYDFDGDEDLAKLYEIEAIAKYRPEYNIRNGGEGGTVHPDTARKISVANKGRPSFLKGNKFAPDALARFRATKAANGKPPPGLGKKMSPHTKEALRVANLTRPHPMKGKTFSLEIRQRMSEAARKRKPAEFSAATREYRRNFAREVGRANSKPVRCITDGRVFESARAASLFYGWPKNKVSKLISGEIKNHPSGRKFAYVAKETD